MKKTFIALLLAIGSTLAVAQPQTHELFNFGWKFHVGDVPDAYRPDYDDSEWRTLDLPHDYQIEMPWDKDAGGARGFKAMSAGWYRKSFDTDPAWQGRRVVLDFEGIIYLGDVYVNGQLVARTDYGYVGFEVDITRLLRPEGENVVAVRADTGKAGGSRWYTGGGIFRDVHLVVKPSVAIARHGIYITTPQVSEASTQVAVQVAIDGDKTQRADVAIDVRIIDADGQEVASTHLPAIGRNKLRRAEVDLPVMEVSNCHLWSTDSPYLYTAEVTLTRGEEIVDQSSDTFGMRTIEYSPEFGFKLNGEKLFLRGISNHHDLGAVGAAAYETAIERQLLLMKEFGYNLLRCSHNPYSPALLRLADKLGILIIDELIDKWSDNEYWGGRRPFMDLWDELLPEWICRDRNHPSVILWSFGNELQVSEAWAGYDTGDWGVTTYRIFDVMAKRYDHTRPTTVAMFPSRAGAIYKADPDFLTCLTPPELATVTEVSCFNYRYKDYPQYLQAAPHMIILQSEATVNELAAPYFGMDHERMVGLAYWGAIAYWGESNGWPKKGWNYSFFSHCLQPYPQAYLIKSAFSAEPLVRIGVMENREEMEWNDVTVGHIDLSYDWNREEGEPTSLFTFTNADEVELMLNGRSMGVKRNPVDNPDRRNVIYWDSIPYTAGQLIAIARTDGQEVARHAVETTGRPVALRIEAETPDTWEADGQDLQYIHVWAVDGKGRRVPDATLPITIDLSGECTLLALDNDDQYTDELFDVNPKAMYRGYLVGILRSGRTPGKVIIKASAEGVKAAKLSLEMK